MNRRTFLQGFGLGAVSVGAVSFLAGGETALALSSCEPDVLDETVVRVRPANGQARIIGVAVEDVQKGDVLEIVTSGPVWVRRG